MKGQQRIETMYAYIVVDVDGTEGVPALKMGDMAMPMIASDAARVEQLRPSAERIAREYGRTVTLAQFTTRVDVETIT